MANAGHPNRPARHPIGSAEGGAIDDIDPPSKGEIYELALVGAYSKIRPDDARRLLVEFVRQAARPKDVDERLIEHVRDCFAAFLAGDGAASLDQAFGLKRAKRGQPEVDEQPMIEAAAMVLNERLAGATHQEALAAAEAARRAAGLAVRSERHIGTAWRDYKHDALLAYRLRRQELGEAWTPAELKRLRRIFANSKAIAFPDDPSPVGSLTELLAAFDVAAKNSGNS